MSTVSAVLLKCGSGVEPEPIMVTGLESIQMIVGGNIEAVRVTAQDNENPNQPIELVGYCNDEGMVLDMETNWLASALFRQEIRGNVVVVTDDGNGNDCDVPDKMVKWMTTRFLNRVVESYNEATMLSEVLAYAVQHHLIPEDEIREVMEMLGDDIDNGGQSSEAIRRMNELIEKIEKAIIEQVSSQHSSTLVSEVEEFLRTETEK